MSFKIENGILKKYDGDEAHIVIPEGVTAIGYAAFRESKIVSVIIPEGVKSIENQAFWGCHDLEEIYIPKSVTQIERKSVCAKRIFCAAHGRQEGWHGVWAVNSDIYYWNCNGIFEQDGIKYISRDVGAYVYSADKELKSVVIPESVNGMAVVGIEANSFRYHDAKEFSIPDSIRSIGEGAFYGTKALTEEGGITYACGAWVVECDKNLKKAAIKDGAVGIAEYAFRGCLELENLNVPDSVVHVSTNAFSCSDRILTSGKLDGEFCKKIKIRMYTLRNEASEKSFYGYYGHLTLDEYSPDDYLVMLKAANGYHLIGEYSSSHVDYDYADEKKKHIEKLPHDALLVKNGDFFGCIYSARYSETTSGFSYGSSDENYRLQMIFSIDNDKEICISSSLYERSDGSDSSNSTFVKIAKIS